MADSIQPGANSTDTTGLDFPAPPRPLRHHGSWEGMSWSEFMDETAWQTIHYLQHRGRERAKISPDRPRFSIG